MTAGPPGAPVTVMVKAPASGGVSLGFFNEQAALELLSQLKLDPPVSPEPSAVIAPPGSS